MGWTWDQDKNRINRQKHNISFDAARFVFDDPFTITEEDTYPYEQRWKTIGIVRQAVLIVIHTWPEGGHEPGRIISARKANRHERRDYEAGYAKTD